MPDSLTLTPSLSRLLPLLLLLLLLLLPAPVCPVKLIKNGLAPPEIVHSPIDSQPRCTVHATPLDLVFVLDSSGSLRNQFQDEVDVIRRIVRHVTIGPSATRVMLIQFSGVQHLEFAFSKFTDRDDLLAALDVLRHVSGITRIGGAFDFALQHMTAENVGGVVDCSSQSGFSLLQGMRDSSVPKLIYLLSDGRTHDYPRDYEIADLIRARVPNVDLWAYGTGEYVALPALLNYTRDAAKIVTNKDLHRLESLFDRWRGTEVCQQQPVCIRGSDKPLDLALLIDSSDSVDKRFNDQLLFIIERIVQHVNVHPEAVRLALITYSGQPVLHFAFNSVKYGNNSAVIRYLNSLRSMKGITATHLALHDTFELFANRDGNSGARQGVRRLAVVLTDGHSQRSPRAMAKRLQGEGVDVLAVSLTPPPMVDEDELLVLAQGRPEHVFMPRNMQDFETVFTEYVGFGCPGMALNPNSGRVRGATDVECDASSVTLTVRIQQPMRGFVYAQQHHGEPGCIQAADGNSRQVVITFREGSCGLSKVASPGRDGFIYNITVLLQFHPLIITGADQALDVSCFHRQPLSAEDVGRSSQRHIGATTCSYRLHRFGPSECAALDAKVGETLFHKWQCDSPANVNYLVHDCHVSSDSKTLAFIDSDGCAIDEHILETPLYSRLLSASPSTSASFIYQEMAVFMLPGEQNLVFHCQLSLCDLESGAPCTQMIPPKCDPRRSSASAPLRQRRSLPSTLPTPPRAGFSATLQLETRTLNVLESEAMQPLSPVKYCDIRSFF